MQISFTEKKNIRKSFGKLKESLSIPNLIEVQKNSYDELTFFNPEAGDLTKGFDRVFKSIFPIEDLNDKATFCLLYTSPSPRDRTRSRMPSSA